MKRGIIVTVIISLLIISLVGVAYAGFFDRFLGKKDCPSGQVLVNKKCVKMESFGREKPLKKNPLDKIPTRPLLEVLNESNVDVLNESNVDVLNESDTGMCSACNADNKLNIQLHHGDSLSMFSRRGGGYTITLKGVSEGSYGYGRADVEVDEMQMREIIQEDTSIQLNFAKHSFNVYVDQIFDDEGVLNDRARIKINEGEAQIYNHLESHEFTTLGGQSFRVTLKGVTNTGISRADIIVDPLPQREIIEISTTLGYSSGLIVGVDSAFDNAGITNDHATLYFCSSFDSL